MSPSLPPTADPPQPAPQSYRDLVHRMADGDDVPEVKMFRWRREEQLVRSALQYPKAYDSTSLTPAHFAAPLHGKVWQAFLNIVARNATLEGILDPEDQSVPEPLLVAELAEVDEALGGNHASNYVRALLVETAIDPKYGLQVLVKELYQQHRNRRWIQNYIELAERLDQDRDIPGVQGDIVRTSAGVVYEAQGDARVCKALDSIEWDPHDTLDVVPTGIQPIDHFAAGGHGRGELLVVGAGTGVGKSYLAQRIMRQQARLKQPCAYIGCEDPYELMYCRTLADFCEPAVPPAAIRQRHVDAEIIELAKKRMAAEYAGRVFIAVHKKATISQVCELIRSHRFSKDVVMVIIDYLQAICADEPMQNKVQEMGHVTSQLKRTASESGVALIAFSQLAREEYRDGAEPSINACKYCGDIENEAEIMVMMWRDSDGVLHAKLPKIKWAPAQNLRYIVPVHPVTGCHGEWVIDDNPPPTKGGKGAAAA